MHSSHNRLRDLWFNVAMIPLKKQTNYDVYAVAKMEEATALDYPTRAWKDLLKDENHENDTLKESIREHLIAKSLQQEWKQYYEVEAWKTRMDFIQHLLSKGRVNGDWELVLSLQLQDLNHKTEFIHAFCGEQLLTAKQQQKPTMKLWEQLYKNNLRENYNKYFIQNLPSFIQKIESLWRQTITSANVQVQSDQVVSSTVQITFMKVKIIRHVFDHLEQICISPEKSIHSMLYKLGLYRKRNILDFLDHLKIDVAAIKKKKVLFQSIFCPGDYSDSLLKPCLDKIVECFNSCERLSEMKMEEVSRSTVIDYLEFILAQQPFFQLINDENNDYNLLSVWYQKQLASEEDDPVCTLRTLKIAIKIVVEAWMNNQTDSHNDNSHHYCDCLKTMFSFMKAYALKKTIKEKLVLRCYTWLQFSVRNQKEDQRTEQSHLLLQELSHCQRHFSTADIRRALEKWDLSLENCIRQEFQEFVTYKQCNSEISSVSDFLFSLNE
jgi:hypothetical protein